MTALTEIQALKEFVMNKIASFSIKEITVSGFKCFSEEQRFDFGDITYITGDNHVGKSSIADALAFAVTGKLYSGDSAMDRLYSDGTRYLRILVGMMDDQGRPHTLTRIRREDKMTITFDGNEVRQKDMEILFGESDVFLSIFNPTYFIERLGSDGQKLLRRYLPVVDHTIVLEKLTEHQQALLEHLSMLSPETFIGQLREDIQSDQQALIALDGQQELLSLQRQENQKELSGMTEQLTIIEEQLSTLRVMQAAGMDFPALEEQRTTLLLRLDEALADKPVGTTQLDLNIQRAIADLEAGRQKSYDSKYAPEIIKLQGELAADSDAYRKVYAAFQNVRAGVHCPTCRRPITSDNQEDIKAGLNGELQGMMRLGMEKNVQLAGLMELDQKAQEVFNQWKTDDTARLQERLARLKQQRETVLSSGPDSIAELNKKLAEVEADLNFGSLPPDEQAQLTALEAQREELSARLTAMQSLLERPEPDIAVQRKSLEESILHNSDLVSTTLDYLGVRNRLQFKDLPLQKVSISLVDILKTTGEVKNTFRFNYDGRDYRKLSHSEKIFAGMEVSELMKALTGRNYPVFVDDSESVVSLGRKPTGQVLLSRVVAQQPLMVTAHFQEPRKLLKAS